MRIAFAGTPDFAAVALDALLAAGHEVGLVLAQPDRPAGRGQQLQAGPVKQRALARGIAVHTPATLRAERGDERTAAALQALRALDPQVLVVAAYGLLLPEAVLALPRGLPVGAGRAGAINIHASLLPRWRGAAPVVRAIEAGDAQTGVCIMQMEAGLDTGPVLLREAVAIGPQESAGALTARLARLGADLAVAALREGEAGRLQAQPQPAEGVRYAHKVEKREAWIDWRRPAPELAAQVRAFDPFPGACSGLDGVTLKFWRAQPQPAPDGAPAPGTLVAAGPAGLVVACAAGTALRITELQRPGGKRLDAQRFLAGTPVAAGSVLHGERRGHDGG
jgi:methionyl-tRNA formyltransferase